MSIYDVVSDIRVLYLSEEINTIKRIVKDLNKKVEILEYKLEQKEKDNIENNDNNENNNDHNDHNENNIENEKKEIHKKRIWPIVTVISFLSGCTGLWFYKKKYHL